MKKNKHIHIITTCQVMEHELFITNFQYFPVEFWKISRLISLSAELSLFWGCGWINRTEADPCSKSLIELISSPRQAGLGWLTGTIMYLFTHAFCTAWTHKTWISTGALCPCCPELNVPQLGFCPLGLSSSHWTWQGCCRAMWRNSSHYGPHSPEIP